MERKTREQLKKSHQDFINIVWPNFMFNKMLGGGTLICCELKDDDLSRNNDLKAGIDFIQNLPIMEYVERFNEYIKIELTRSLAVRVRQKINWRGFTIRYSHKDHYALEYDKRVAALKYGWTYPCFTIQAHIINNNLISAAIINTNILYGFVKQYGINNLIQKTNNDCKNSFIDIKWDLLINNGIQFIFFDLSKSPNLFQVNDKNNIIEY